ncbi:hypothetical protein GCM10010116_24450 [Microbispora rosea subsp. aerata]|nr:hypothetical protein [Microbispora rosea]GGO12193.1 hypothetical protein GCM10010116_24450 [Microbispora rosea subsp. aerata]GIH58604.1 hypothetical protein Mro02_55180 [Microbispora rosea subsp. aerata]GLJ84714.1 hypothetical protein GCM10017588_34420 [Microbispora rosea subsp. aerata]
MTKPITSQMYHFTQNNPEGIGQDSVPALLRRVATTIEQLGPVEVYDLVMHNEVTEDGADWPSITVYFDYKNSGEPEDDEGDGEDGQSGQDGRRGQDEPGVS